MAKFDHPIVHRVSELEFPRPDRVFITHSAALSVRGVELGRPLGDIDIVTDGRNLDYIARKMGWAATPQIRYYEDDLPEKIRSVVSPDGEFDMYICDFMQGVFNRTRRGRTYTDQMLKTHDARYDQDEETKLWVASFMHVEATLLETERSKDASTHRRLQQHFALGY